MTLSLSPFEVLEFLRLDEFSLDEMDVVSAPSARVSVPEKPKVGRLASFVGDSGAEDTKVDADLVTAVDWTRVAAWFAGRGLGQRSSKVVTLIGHVV